MRLIQEPSPVADIRFFIFTPNTWSVFDTFLGRGETVAVENVCLVGDAGGLRAVDAQGKDLGGHQAFWFAWSRFHPGTRPWPRRDGD